MGRARAITASFGIGGHNATLSTATAITASVLGGGEPFRV